jgi:PKD repeat protein
MYRLHLVLSLIIFFFYTSCVYSQKQITGIEPFVNELVFDSNVVISWNKNIQEDPMTSYDLQVSRDSLFGSIVHSNLGLLTYNDTVTVRVPGKYYWRVELKKGTSIISTSSTFKFIYQDIFKINGLSLILQADSGVLLDANNKVKKWINLADTSRSAEQFVSSARPSLIVSSNGINTSPAVHLDGMDDMLEVNSNFNMSDYFIVANWTGNQSGFPNYNGLLSGKTNYYLIVADPTSGGKQFLTTSSAFSINQIVTNNFSPLNVSKLIAFKGNSSVNRSDMIIGRDRANISRYWDGDVSEIIFSSAPLNDSLRNIVNKYLCQKYSNTLSLGADINIQYGFCDTLVQVDTNFSSYRWSNGDSTSASLLTPGSTYQLTVTNKFGCSYTDEIYLTTPVKPKKGAVLCLGETYIWNTELSNSDYNFLWSNLTTDSALTISQPGNYFVRITDTNNCFIDSDTITVSYDSTLAKITLGPDTSICLGYEIGLQNPPSGITSYLWSTNQTVPRIVPQSTGMYWLEVSANGCTERDSIFVTIRGDAPTADFIANDVCFGEIVNFIDVSTNPTSGLINQWRWNFGNTQNSVQQNPTVLYDSVKTYTVSLYIETDAQCSDSITKTVTINPKPVAGFTNSLACKGDSIFFTDTSSVSAGTIQYWRWKYNDLNQNPDTSRLQNPSAVFSVAQNYPIQLFIESDLGCKDTVIQNLKVNDLPVPNYIVSGSCLGDSTRFVNSTVLPQGNTLKTISWRFGNNTASIKVNPTIFYPTPKFYLVTLETEASSGCKATIQRQFEMNDKPIADFKTTEFCLNNQGQVTDLSTVTRTTLSNWNYNLNQLGGYQDSSIVQNPNFTLRSLNDFELTQTVTSLKGCKDTASKVIMVRNNPKALFNLQTNTGATPFVVKFDTISPSTNYKWSFGNGDSAFVYRPKYTYQDTGVYQIKLLLSNQFGCVDSMKRTVDVNVPNLNLFFDTIVVDQKNNLVRVGVVLINTGNNEINSVRMSANFNSNYRIEETWTGQLFPNDFVYTEFTSSVSLGSSGLNDFTCVEILAVNDFDDLNLIKDEICVKGTSPRLFLKGYPNPTEQDMTIEMVVPNEGVVTAKVFDNLGREQFFLFDEERSEGFYRFEVQSSILGSGVYYLIVEYKGASYKLPFIKK